MKYFHNDNRADGSDHFSRLRLLLLVPSLIGECLVVLSIPQLSLFCHEVAMMILGGSLPCAALQVYISPHETGVAELCSELWLLILIHPFTPRDDAIFVLISSIFILQRIDYLSLECNF